MAFPLAADFPNPLIEPAVGERLDRPADEPVKQLRLQRGESVDLGLVHAHRLAPAAAALLGPLQRRGWQAVLPHLIGE